MERFINRITLGDCREHLPRIDRESIHLFLSDIPYGIGLDEWDVLHENANSAYLGHSPAQSGKPAFKRRGKPINGWSAADKDIIREYEAWCRGWAAMVFPLMKKGASLFIFGARRTLHRAIVALEDEGFMLRDVLIWKKSVAHHRSQQLAKVLKRRGEESLAEHWRGWRLGNLAPIYEPVAWLFKPYERTITDNVLEHGVGAMNVGACLVDGKSPTNVLDLAFAPNEQRVHEAQKPLDLVSYLIRLTTLEGHVVLDPFIGSGTTAVACKKLRRRFIGFEKDKSTFQLARQRVAKEVKNVGGNQKWRP